MVNHCALRGTEKLLVAGVLVGGILVLGVNAQSPAAVPAGSPPAAKTASRYQPNRFAGRAGKYYEFVWGVDTLGVRPVESGEVIRFTYRVLDADKANALNNKKSAPFFVNPTPRLKL